ncbi:MAG: phage holin family protein [Endomicrobia bacterium]|nr:phage holin family protein [Endomicrobiia bacterium]
MLARLVINAAAILVAVNVVRGISIPSWEILIAVVIVISLLNAILKPVLIVITLPINILTLGLFMLFINAFMMYLASKLVNGFHVEDFWSAFWGALIFSIVSIFLNMFIGGNKSRKRRDNGENI